MLGRHSPQLTSVARGPPTRAQGGDQVEAGEPSPCEACGRTSAWTVGMDGDGLCVVEREGSSEAPIHAHVFRLALCSGAREARIRRVTATEH